MSIPPPLFTPAGWYPDPAGAPIARWWDGQRWTNQVHDPRPVAPRIVMKAPEGTSAYTPFAWLFVAVIAVQLAALAWFDLDGYLLATVAPQSPFAMVTPSYLVLLGTGLVSYLLYVVLAFLDHRALVAAGVPSPFHWAWTFTSAIVYPIGRTIVVRRRTGHGLGILWAAIAATLIYLAVLVIKIIVAIASLMSTLSVTGGEFA